MPTVLDVARLHILSSFISRPCVDACMSWSAIFFRLIDANNSCINAEIRTRIPESIPREYIIDDEGNLPISFAVKVCTHVLEACMLSVCCLFFLPIDRFSCKAPWHVNTAQSAALKEVIDDLEWPGSNITITLSPAPPGVSFRGEGHGDLQVHFSHFLSVNKFFLSLPPLKNHLGLKLGSESLDIAHTEILSVSCRSGKCPLPLAHSDRTASLFHGSTLILDMLTVKVPLSKHMRRMHSRI